MTIHVEPQHEGQLLHVTLDAPPGNILDEKAMHELLRVIARAREEHKVKALRFEGAGAHFCYGASIEEHAPESAATMLHRFHWVFRKLLEAAVPTMAVVRGRCLGGGLELAAMCSFVFASKDALFAQPEIRLALFPPMASILLPWRMGAGAALDLCVSGRTWTAETARGHGLVSSVDADPRAASDAFFQEHLAPRSASSLRMAEHAARFGLSRLMEDQLEGLERLYLDGLMQTNDAREGIAAFMERRSPHFEDR